MSRNKCLAVASAIATFSFAQERLTPEKSKGGAKYTSEPWADIPESFRSAKPPEWPLPTDLKQWQEAGRAAVRKTLLECLAWFQKHLAAN